MKRKEGEVERGQESKLERERERETDTCAYGNMAYTQCDEQLVWLFNTYFKYLNANQCKKSV